MDGRLLLALVVGATGAACGWWAPDLARWLDLRWGLADEKAVRACPPPHWHRAALAVATASAALAASLTFQGPLTLALAAVAIAWLCAVAAIDLRTRFIPNRLTYPALLAAPVSALLWTDVSLGSHLAGAAVCAGFFLVALLASRGALGLGDVKLALVLGAYLGLERGVVAMIVTLALGGVAAAVALVSGMSRKDSIAYGPSLCAGGAVALCAGDALWRGYLAHLGIT